MSFMASTLLPIAVLLLGSAMGVGFLAAAWTSVGEGERRAAWLMALFAVTLPLPYWILAFADSAYRLPLGGGLLLLTLLGGIALLLPSAPPRIDDDRPNGRIDERDIMFSRRLLERGTDRFREYYAENPEKKALDDLFREKPGLLSEGSSAYHPLAFRASDASFTTIEHLRPFVDGEPAADAHTLSAETATRFLERWILKLGAVSVGFTVLEDYHLYSTVGRGPDYGVPVTLNHRFAIAFTVEMDKETMDHAPLAPTVMESAQQYVESGVIAVQVAEFIRRLGYPARAHIDGDYRVVCPLVARDAGLGEIGRMGLLMTPGLGPRVRIAVVTTDLALVASERRRDPTVLDFCIHCSKCADVCPSDAIPLGDRADVDGVRRWQIDSEACYTLWSTTGTDCARCMAVCPYSHPDNWMHSLVRRGVQGSGRFRRLAVWGDDVFYGRRPPPRPLPEWMGPAS